MPPVHEIDQHRSEAGFDHMSAEAPDDAAAAPLRVDDRAHHRLEIGAGEDVRQRLDERPEARARFVRPAEIVSTRLARPRFQRIGLHAREIEFFVRKDHKLSTHRGRRGKEEHTSVVERFQSISIASP